MKLALIIVALGLGGFAAGYFRGAESGGVAGVAPARSDARLRSKDPAEVLASLRKLAEEDPRTFFKELRRAPMLGGLDEIVGIAAKGLADMDASEAAELFNKIPNNHLRTAAWASFLTARPDRPVEEQLKMAKLAGSLGWQVVRRAIVEPGLASDPEGTLKALRLAEHADWYRNALRSAAESRPDLMAAYLKDDLVSGLVKPGQCQAMLESLTVNNQSPELLSAISGLIKAHGWREGIYAGPIFQSALTWADHPGEVIEAVATLPTVQKNFVLSKLGVSADDPVSGGRVLNLMDSTELQLGALRQLREGGVEPAKLAELAAQLKSERTRALWRQEQDAPGR